MKRRRSLRCRTVVLFLLSGLLVLSACTGGTKKQRPAVVPSAKAATDPTSAVCGLADPSLVAAKAAAQPLAKSVHTLVPALANTAATSYFGGLQIANDTVYATAVHGGTTVLRTFSLSGAPLHQLTLPVDTVGPDSDTSQQFAVGADGSVYLPDRAAPSPRLKAFSKTGNLLWSADLASDGAPISSIQAVFGWRTAAGQFVVGVAFGQQVILLDPTGKQVGAPLAIAGNYVSAQSDGTLLTSVSSDSASYAERYGNDGRLLSRFGSAAPQAVAGVGQTPGDGAISTFNQLSGMTQLADGTLLLADSGAGLRQTTKQGYRLGLIPDAYPDSFTLMPQTPLISSGDRVYFVGATQGGSTAAILWMDRTAIGDQLRQGAFYTEDTAGELGSLGYGAGLSTSATDNYFASGRAPQVEAVFDDWWQSVASTLKIVYTVSGAPRDGRSALLTQGEQAMPTAGQPALLALPPATPGAYQVQAELRDRTSSAVRGSTCLTYTVGAPGAALDFAKLPGEPDWGGAPPQRAIALAAQLGAKEYRWSLDFQGLVPDASGPQTEQRLKLTTDDGADLVSQVEQVALQAKAAGVTLLLQLSQGDSTAQAAVAAGTWEGWVRAIATVFAREAPDASVWSPWNEPNNTGFPDGGVYAKKVLIPFSRAVKAAEPAATIVGGESLNVSVDWWSQVAAGGGCSALDVVGIHPYSDLNESWEESGLTGPNGQLAALKAVLAGCGVAARPIWDTESGWTSDGARNQWGQADAVARAAMWMKVYTISQWNYFITEGGFGDNDLSLSLIQYKSHVKPAALAFMTSNRMLAGRTVPTTVDAGTPGAHAMSFAPVAGSPDRLLAAWTDDLDIDSQLMNQGTTPVSLTVTTEYGACTTLVAEPGKPLALQLSGAVTYINVPATAQLAIVPAQPFGPDLLAGANAQASSTAAGTSASALVSTDLDNQHPWKSGASVAGGGADLAPVITVTPAQPQTFSRVLVAGQSIMCCSAGLRTFGIEAQQTDGSWHSVARVSNLFYQRAVLASFKPVLAKAIRIAVGTRTEDGISVMDVNYSGQIGGLHPVWWGLKAESDGVLAIRSIQAFGP